jgi:hypothetical protein
MVNATSIIRPWRADDRLREVEDHRKREANARQRVFSVFGYEAVMTALAGTAIQRPWERRRWSLGLSRLARTMTWRWRLALRHSIRDMAVVDQALMDLVAVGDMFKTHVPGLRGARELAPWLELGRRLVMSESRYLQQCVYVPLDRLIEMVEALMGVEEQHLHPAVFAALSQDVAVLLGGRKERPATKGER